MTKAGQLAGADPDYSIKDLFEAIATGNFVSCSFEYGGYEGGVANAQPGLYSYHFIIITAVCSVGVTEVITFVYLLPTFSFNVVMKRKLLEPEICRIQCFL